MSNLVIVESPAKAKTIKKYLGEDYNVIASMGHIRDLPKGQIAIDFDNNFKPRYINIPGKSKLIKELKEMAAASDMVYLATDPDREGEAISWHLAHILKLDTQQSNRVTFGEITKKGITDGMANKRTIDMDLINAQQARRILDRIVGYKLSPFLWEKIKGGLSAGRVQSVATSPKQVKGINDAGSASAESVYVSVKEKVIVNEENIGDSNNDGSVNITDATIILRYYSCLAAGVSMNHEGGFNRYYADANGDGSLDLTDAGLVLKYYSQRAAGFEPNWSDLLSQ